MYDYQELIMSQYSQSDLREELFFPPRSDATH